MYSGILRRRTNACFCNIVTHFRGCNGIGDLLTRQARNFIYNYDFFSLEFKQHSVLNKFGKHNFKIPQDLEQSAHTIHVPRDILQLKVLEIV